MDESLEKEKNEYKQNNLKINSFVPVTNIKKKDTISSKIMKLLKKVIFYLLKVELIIM